MSCDQKVYLNLSTFKNICVCVYQVSAIIDVILSFDDGLIKRIFPSIALFRMSNI